MNQEVMVTRILLLIFLCINYFSYSQDVPNGLPIDSVNLKDVEKNLPEVHPIYKNKYTYKGVRLFGEFDSEVITTANGQVISIDTTVYSDGSRPNFIVTIKHENNFRTKYIRLKEVKVKLFEQVVKGASLGVGSDKDSKDGSDCYFKYEVYLRGRLMHSSDFL